MGKFVVKEAKGGLRFNLKAGNGEIIGVSEVYSTESACMNGIAFTMINYALKFALDNIGLALGVIVLVLQVAGAGGTFPVEVLPAEFRALYPFMPFRYAMDAMRECVAGAYGNTWLRCMAVLLVFTAASAVIGLLLYRPAQRLNRLISESMSSSDLLHE